MLTSTMMAVEMGESDHELFIEMLLKLDGTHDSVKAASKWCRANAQHHDVIVKTWFWALAKSRTMDRRLDLFHLASDILFTADRKSLPFFCSFLPILVKAVPLVRGEGIKLSMKKLFCLWREKDIYNEAIMDELDKSLRNRNKVVDNNVFYYDQDLLFQNMARICRLQPAIDYLRFEVDNSQTFDNSQVLLSNIKDRKTCASLLRAVDNQKKQVKTLVDFLEEMVHLLKTTTNDLDMAANREQNGIETVKLKLAGYGRFGEKVRSVQDTLVSVHHVELPVKKMDPVEKDSLFTRRPVNYFSSSSDSRGQAPLCPTMENLGQSVNSMAIRPDEYHSHVTEVPVPPIGSITPSRNVDYFEPSLMSIPPRGGFFTPAANMINPIFGPQNMLPYNDSLVPARENFEASVGSMTPVMDDVPLLSSEPRRYSQPCLGAPRHDLWRASDVTSHLADNPDMPGSRNDNLNLPSEPTSLSCENYTPLEMMVQRRDSYNQPLASRRDNYPVPSGSITSRRDSFENTAKPGSLTPRRDDYDASWGGESYISSDPRMRRSMSVYSVDMGAASPSGSSPTRQESFTSLPDLWNPSAHQASKRPPLLPTMRTYGLGTDNHEMTAGRDCYQIRGREQAMTLGRERAMTPGRDYGMNPGRERAMTPGRDLGTMHDRGRAMTPGRDRGMTPGRERAMTPGRDCGMNPGRERAMTPGRELGTIHDRRRAMTPGRERGVTPGRERAMTPGRDYGMNPGRERAMTPGRDLGTMHDRGRAMTPGRDRGMTPGRERAMTPGRDCGMNPGRERAMTPGRELGTIHDRRRAMTPGRERVMTSGRERGMTPGRERAMTPGRDCGMNPGRERAMTPGRDLGTIHDRGRAMTPGRDRGMTPSRERAMTPSRNQGIVLQRELQNTSGNARGGTPRREMSLPPQKDQESTPVGERPNSGETGLSSEPERGTTPGSDLNTVNQWASSGKDFKTKPKSSFGVNNRGRGKTTNRGNTIRRSLSQERKPTTFAKFPSGKESSVPYWKRGLSNRGQKNTRGQSSSWQSSRGKNPTQGQNWGCSMTQDTQPGPIGLMQSKIHSRGGFVASKRENSELSPFELYARRNSGASSMGKPVQRAGCTGSIFQKVNDALLRSESQMTSRDGSMSPRSSGSSSPGRDSPTSWSTWGGGGDFSRRGPFYQPKYTGILRRDSSDASTSRSNTNIPSLMSINPKNNMHQYRS